MQLRESPFSSDLSKSEEQGVQAFRRWIWHNSELCNECMSRVRDIGPEVSRVLGRGGATQLVHADVEMRTNEWYERTELATQEHSPGDHNTRFGTCYCLECGGDLSANHRGKSLEELKPIAANIARYVREHTDLELDVRGFARELRTLKRRPEYQSWETEILAVAFARGLRT